MRLRYTTFHGADVMKTQEGNAVSEGTVDMNTTIWIRHKTRWLTS
jgi:hypothetical protein